MLPPEKPTTRTALEFTVPKLLSYMGTMNCSLQ
jgi:hypothetical protein